MTGQSGSEDDAGLRASDAERDAVAARLREAHAEGRLTFEELSERLDVAFAARTHGDLVPLTRDLPAPQRAVQPGDLGPAVLLAGLGGRAVGRRPAAGHPGTGPSP
jgi:hypothetical protein